MPDRCAVFGCSNLANSGKGISLHRIPFWNDERPEAKRRRKIATKRAKWSPRKYSAVCSEHFTENDYERYLVEIPGTREYTPRLKKDDIGITAYPSVFKKSSNFMNEISPREKRKVCLCIYMFDLMFTIDIACLVFLCIFDLRLFYC